MAQRTPEEERCRCRFTSSISFAVSEWLLIILLFFNGFFSYLVTKFARFCKLQVPCLFCSRLDHFLGCESPGFYKNLICDTHKLEISSLAYCHIHRKLADVREMCEACLLSFATEKKSNSETYRSLVGKLEISIDNEERAIPMLPKTAENDGSKSKFQAEYVGQVPLLKNDGAFGFLRKRYCSCCNEAFRMKSYAHRLLQVKSIGAGVAEHDVPVLGLTGHDRAQRRDGLSKRKDILLIPPTVSHGGHDGFDRLSHIGYSELKITSDSESEVPVSDEDDGNTLVKGSVSVKQEHLPRCLQPDLVVVDANPSKNFSDDLAQEKLIHTAPVTPDTLFAVPEKQIHTEEPSDAASLALNDTTAHGLEELNWNEVGGGPHLAISDVPSPPIPTELSNSKNIAGADEVACISSTATGGVSKASESSCKQSQIISGSAISAPSIMDLNDAYKLIVNKGVEPSPRDSSRVQEDLRLLLSQISRGFEFPWNDMTPSPRGHGGEDSKISDASGSNALQNFTRRLSIERNESGFESSLDGSVFSEIDGESAVDRLKRHVELDRKSLSILYKELEEERSASAIAANQAMAMITRLQEEKAAMQMEALQYQRMMEEQAEYDQEVLQKSNDLLAQRENEIQDLEAELASYRKRFNNEYEDDEMLWLMNDTEERGNIQISTPRVRQSAGGSRSNQIDMVTLDSDRDKIITWKDSLLEFEHEKVYISECLKKLEEKLHRVSSNGVNADASGHDVRNDGLPDNITENGRLLGKDSAGENDVKQIYLDEVQENSQIRDNASSMQKDSRLSRENSYSEERHIKEFTFVDNQREGLLSHNPKHESQQSSAFDRGSDLATVENEISYLNDKLRSLEADQSFLEHTIKSLQNGSEGLHFVREIAFHLRELRKVGVRRDEPVT